MKLENDNITTPVYLKTEVNMEWPKDPMFYILSSDGLYLCRNHKWFTTCALSKHGPGELEPQKPFCKLKYPIIPRAIIEKAVGFFRHIEFEKHWESALILAWNITTQAYELVCPDQKASGASVKYDIPALPPHLMVVGDIHSHCNFSPHPSMTDEGDEENRPGLHIIAGYIDREQPEFAVVAVVDGQRFTVTEHKDVMEPHIDSDPDDAPEEWVKKVKPSYTSTGGWGSDYNDGYWSKEPIEPEAADMKIINAELARFMAYEHRPSWQTVSNVIFRETKRATIRWCEKRAKEFVKEWKAAHAEAPTQ